MTSEMLAPITTDPTSWNRAAARHLLDRAGFSATPAAVNAAAAAGLDATVDRLINEQPETEEFLRVEPLLRRVALDTSSIDSLKEWWLFRCRFSRNPVREKMSVLWHNHFATSHAKVQSVPWMLDQNELFRRHALGDFRELLHAMARDVAMLVWLDGNDNRKRQPNENFAREVMELFSLGVGNYSEKDIQEAARAFSGWHVRNGKFWFNQLQHDAGEKTVFGQTGEFDGDHVIDLCLEQPACPEFLAMKLLRLFVTADPQAAEINAVAGLIRHHDYQMSPVLAELFRSRLFFDPAHRRRLIKSPLDLVIGSLTMLDVQPRFTPVRELLAELGQDLFMPPTVKGWDGHRLWISSATLLLRSNFVTDLLTGPRYGIIENLAEVLGVDPRDASREQLVELAEVLLGQPLESAALDELHRYAEQQPPGDLRMLTMLLLSLPEYQLL